MGELDRALDRRRKLQVQLEGTGARGPARGRRRKQAEEKLAEIQGLLAAFESGLVFQDQNRRAQARERRRPAETVRSVSDSFLRRVSEIVGGIEYLHQFVVEATLRDSNTL